MIPDNDGTHERRERLSALADGEVDASGLAAGCAEWDDPAARSTWHTYHLIGDVLRSDDLAADPARDAEFLQRLRGRLAEEPTLLRPRMPDPVRSESRRSTWAATAAVAAGFVAVAGVVVVTRLSMPSIEGAAPTLASSAMPPAGSPGPRPLVVGSPASALPGSIEVHPVANGVLIRHAQLDHYLRLHRDAAAGLPVAMPGGAPRRFESVLADR